MPSNERSLSLSGVRCGFCSLPGGQSSMSDSSPAPHRALQSSLFPPSSGDNWFFSKILLSLFAGRIAGCSDSYSSVQIVLYSSQVRGRQKSYVVSQVSLSNACSFSASNKQLLVGPARVSPGKGRLGVERKTSPKPVDGGPAAQTQGKGRRAADQGVYP